ncbi:UNVERIFIED_CONTAM: hypothetical protein PYX00_001710 [Menopon gallinae]|uniref:SOWAHA-C winged helix-turn-helix domain-containing protein n=1 Tax=Menopon gallinae TaxID=328185 RepID=A0AAW2IDR7_9NEOP
MAGPNELSFDAVRDFILKNGGKVRNHDLVKHFKKFLTRPESRDDARNYFKEIVNQVAVIRTEDNEKYLVLKKKFRPPDYAGDPASSCSSPSPSSPSPRQLYEPQFPSPPRQPPPYRAPPPPVPSPVPKIGPAPDASQSAPTTPLSECDQNVPPVPPRRRSLPEKEHHESPRPRPMDGTAEMDGDPEKKISVKERMQKFNRMASESDLQRVPAGNAKKKVDKVSPFCWNITSF